MSACGLTEVSQAGQSGGLQPAVAGEVVAGSDRDPLDAVQHQDAVVALCRATHETKQAFRPRRGNISVKVEKCNNTQMGSVYRLVKQPYQREPLDSYSSWTQSSVNKGDQIVSQTVVFLVSLMPFGCNEREKKCIFPQAAGSGSVSDLM